jgi:hypothetical protein
MNLKEWTGAKVASLILLVVTAAIALALAAVVLYVGFGGGNIADLSAMSLDDILDLYGSLFAGEVGKGLSIFGWACVLLGPVGVYLRTGCTSAILSVFLQQHEGRPWLDVLLHAEEDSSYRGVLRAGRIPRYVGWRVRRAGFLF